MYAVWETAPLIPVTFHQGNGSIDPSPPLPGDEITVTHVYRAGTWILIPGHEAILVVVGVTETPFDMTSNIQGMDFLGWDINGTAYERDAWFFIPRGTTSLTLIAEWDE
jgi:hypothetical protein